MGRGGEGCGVLLDGGTCLAGWWEVEDWSWLRGAGWGVLEGWVVEAVWEVRGRKVAVG